MPKLLGEFLQVQQEPFALEVYLVERGYHKVSSHISPKNLKGFLRKRRSRYNSISSCSSFFKAAFGQLVSTRKIKNSENGVQIIHKRSREEENVEDEDLPSVISNIGFSFHTTSDAQNDNLLIQKEGDADRKMKWEGVEDDDDKQLSPVSVLQETQPDEDSPFHHRESSTSNIEELDGSSRCSYSQYITNQKSLRKTKQLLIDCLREVIENHRKRDERRDELKKIFGADELWKLVCENVWLWSQHPIHDTNIFHLLPSDFIQYSAEEWSGEGLEKQKQDISMDVTDAIFEDLISEIGTI